MHTDINSRGNCIIAFSLLSALLGSAVISPSAEAKTTHVAYVPGIALTPEVMLSDGTTPRTYYTPQGLAYWTNDLPIIAGDKIKLNVFAATGGAELKRAIVRLDNQKIAELSGVPWNTVIDTTNMSAGYHMIEAWAEGTGDKPQSSTKSLTFYVSKELPVKYALKGSEEELNNTVVNSVQPSVNPAIPSEIPQFLQGRTMDPNAAIVVRSKDSAVNGNLINGTSEVPLPGPAIVYVEPAKGSDAVSWAYVLSRGDQTIVSSPTRLNLRYERLRLQPRSDTTPGLRSGPVTLWVWGINQVGEPSAPFKTRFVIP